MLGNYTLGFEHSTVWLRGEKYLDRWFFALRGRTYRLHKFYRGDDERAPHSHPWPFRTFPLKSYWEVLGDGTHQLVQAFRWHHRQSSYQHIVLGTSAKADKRGVKFWTPKPFWTIVVTGVKDRSWGFYPDGKYVYWKDFK
jgi:hypothetical protein